MIYNNVCTSEICRITSIKVYITLYKSIMVSSYIINVILNKRLKRRKIMKSYGEKSENLLGGKQRARLKKEMKNLDQYFETPIIHREIHGDKIQVPLNLDKVWNQIS